MRARRIFHPLLQRAVALLLTNQPLRASILRTMRTSPIVLGAFLGLFVLGSCSSVPDSPYRPSDVGVIAEASVGSEGVLVYRLSDGRAVKIDRRNVRFLSAEPDEGDLLLRGETGGQEWAYGVPKAGDCWQLSGGGEVRDGRLATDQQLSLPFAPGFDPDAHGGPRWVNDRGYYFCLDVGV
jgi:hypothetical protein